MATRMFAPDPMDHEDVLELGLNMLREQERKQLDKLREEEARSLKFGALLYYASTIYTAEKMQYISVAEVLDLEDVISRTTDSHVCDSRKCNMVHKKKSEPFEGVLDEKKYRATGDVYLCAKTCKVHICGPDLCFQRVLAPRSECIVCPISSKVLGLLTVSTIPMKNGNSDGSSQPASSQKSGYHMFTTINKGTSTSSVGMPDGHQLYAMSVGDTQVEVSVDTIEYNERVQRRKEHKLLDRVFKNDPIEVRLQKISAVATAFGADANIYIENFGLDKKNTTDDSETIHNRKRALSNPKPKPSGGKRPRRGNSAVNIDNAKRICSILAFSDNGASIAQSLISDKMKEADLHLGSLCDKAVLLRQPIPSVFDLCSEYMRRVLPTFIKYDPLRHAHPFDINAVNYFATKMLQLWEILMKMPYANHLRDGGEQTILAALLYRLSSGLVIKLKVEKATGFPSIVLEEQFDERKFMVFDLVFIPAHSFLARNLAPKRHVPELANKEIETILSEEHSRDGNKTSRPPHNKKSCKQRSSQQFVGSLTRDNRRRGQLMHGLNAVNKGYNSIVQVAQNECDITYLYQFILEDVDPKYL